MGAGVIYLSPNLGPQASKATPRVLTALFFWAVLAQRLSKCLCLGEGPGQIDTVCLLCGMLVSVRWVETCVKVLVCIFERVFLDIFKQRFCHMSLLCIPRKENRSQKNWLKCPVKCPTLRSPVWLDLLPALPWSDQKVAGSDKLVTVAAWPTPTTRCTLASEAWKMRENVLRSDEMR